MNPLTPPRTGLRLLGALVVALVASFGSPAAAVTNTEATQKAVNFLSRDVADWVGSQGCAACHRAGAALYGLSSAKANGYDMSVVTGNGRTNDGNTAFIAQRVAAEQLANGSWTHGGSFTIAKTSYAAFGMAGYDQFVSTQFRGSLQKVADWAVATQQANGRWFADYESYPTVYGNISLTARLMVALAQAKQGVDPAKAAQYQASLDKAADYIRANVNNLQSGGYSDGMPYTSQVGWAIVGLKAAGPGPNGGQNDATIKILADRLQGLTTSNGAGWSDLNGGAANEFDTGMSIYALCLAGRDPDAKLLSAMEWLKTRQLADGSFGNPAAHRDIPTTFAAMGLSCYGDHSVIVTANPTERVVEFEHAEAQTVTYSITIKNHGFQPDNYALSVSGGLEALGWTASLSEQAIFLAAGAQAVVQLTVTVPPNQFPALSSEVTVKAVSAANPGVSGSARVLTYTNPRPPSTGRNSQTTILSPAANAAVTVGETVTLSARVNAESEQDFDAIPGPFSVPVTGPGKGVMTFFVAGVAIGADNDNDGDGVFQVSWSPANGQWNAMGLQNFSAIYSGVTLEPVNRNIKGSSAAHNLDIKAHPYTPPEATLSCIVDRYINTTSLRACGYATPEHDGASLTYIAFIVNGGPPIVVSPTPENLSSGFVETMVTLREGVNVIQLTTTDSFGGITTKQTTVTVDTTPPVLTVVSPQEGQAFSTSSIRVSSTVADISPVLLTTNYVNKSNLDPGGGSVAHMVNLPNRGENTIIVTAQDAAGNLTEKRIKVWVDYRAPVISSTPADGAIIGPKANNVLAYSLRVDTISASTVRIAGQTFNLPRGGGVVQVPLTLVAGVNTIPVTVTSETGITVNSNRTVRYDITAPVAVTLIPVAGGTYSGTITLTATVTDDFSGVKSVGFMRNRSGIKAGVAGPNNTWTYSFDTTQLADGQHTINVRTVDNLNNVAIYDTVFTVNNRGRIASPEASRSSGAESTSLVAVGSGEQAAPACPGSGKQGPALE